MNNTTKALYNAVGVLIKTPRIHEFLTQWDPKALSQATDAFVLATDTEDTLPNCLTHGGTPQEVLVEQRTAILTGLRSARYHLEMAAPHPRDYLFQSSTYEKAQRVYADRLKTLDDMINEIDTETYVISNMTLGNPRR